jgi:hypothetical protein
VFEVSKGRQNIELEEHQLKRVFIHRDGYMIFQDSRDSMKDYKLKVKNPGQMLLTGYEMDQVNMFYSWNADEGIMTFKFEEGEPGGEMLYKARALNWKDLRALKNNFHWTVEGSAE